MGRKPMARRRICIHAGLEPFLTPLINRPEKCGQAFASSPAKSNSILMSLSKPSSIAGWLGVLSVPKPAAAKSRATP